ncbi:MAG TPA: VOC family protein [Burkholderiales bacterium]|nr:VOC family protein [Burkholderiales bacterium]
MAKAVPEGYHTATPYLCVNGAAAAIDFYRKAFGATEVFRIGAPGGRIGHAEIRIGDSRIMISDEFPELRWFAPQAAVGSPVMIHLYVEDVDEVARRAVAAGAKEITPVADQFYGDRGGKFADPWGHLWYLATHKEDVPPEELERRARERL